MIGFRNLGIGDWVLGTGLRLGDLRLGEVLGRLRSKIPSLAGLRVVEIWNSKLDKLVKSQKSLVFVIPANAGIQGNQSLLDSRFRGSDGLGDFLRDHQT